MSNYLSQEFQLRDSRFIVDIHNYIRNPITSARGINEDGAKIYVFPSKGYKVEARYGAEGRMILEISKESKK